jgi:hypothetical protein
MSAQSEDDQAIKTMGRNQLSLSVTVLVIFVGGLIATLGSETKTIFCITAPRAKHRCN